ncbi:hypothetical protein [Nocardia sp. NPDC050175]
MNTEERVKIAESRKRSGVSAPAIKSYLRDGPLMSMDGQTFRYLRE